MYFALNRFQVLPACFKAAGLNVTTGIGVTLQPLR